MSFKALGRVLSSCSWALKGSQHLTTRRFSISSHIMSGYPQTCQELAKLSPAEVQKFMDSFDTVMTDCDGVLWMGDRAFDGAAKMICKFRELGKKVFFCTNNSTKSRADYVEKCKKLGFGGNKDEIIGTSYLAATYLKDMNYKGTVYVVGTNGVKDELDEVGIPCIGIGPDPMPDQWSLDKMAEIASKVGPEVQCVIAAFDNLISYVKLMKAVSVLSRPNSVFVATNTDEQFPFSSSCILPGTGSMVAAIAASAEREPVVMGKPSPMMFEVVQKHHPEVNPKRTLMIGDRSRTAHSKSGRMQSQSRKSLSRSSQLQIWSEDKDSDDDFTETSPFSQNGKKIALKKQTTTRKKNKFKLSMKQPAHSEPKTSRSSNDLKEIQRFQKYPGLLVPKSSFTRVVRDVLKFIGPDLKIQSAALGATQAASETFLTNLMEGANLAAVHAKRVTIMPKDVELYQRLKQL